MNIINLIGAVVAGKVIAEVVREGMGKKGKLDLLIEEVADLRARLDAYGLLHQDAAEEEEQQHEEEEQQQQQQDEEEEQDAAAEGDTPLVEEAEAEDVPVEQEDHKDTNSQSTTSDDKHGLLRQRLANGAEVHVLYKKKVTTANYEVSPDASHGYVFKYNGADYTTPSHFSTYIKKQANPAVQADNGWDSIYIITGAAANGKPIKASLNELIKSDPEVV